MGKMKITPVGGIKKGSTQPNKYVGVDTTSGYYGIKGKYDFDGGASVTGSVTQDFSKADVSYPGGSQTFKSSGKPYVEIKVEKKFGGPKKKDLSKFVEKKEINKSSQDRKKNSNYNQGGIAKGCGGVMSSRRKKTKKL